MADGLCHATMIVPATRAGRNRAAPLRAVTAVIALYALVLQAVLGGLMPLPSAVDHGVLCLGQAGDEDTGQVQNPAAEHHAHLPCCTVPGAVLGPILPEPSAQAVAWPPRVVTRLAWRFDAPVRARGPPGTFPHPRGPPVA
jgi:hypothetical protein